MAEKSDATLTAVELSGSAWKDQAKTIDTAGKPPGGALGEIGATVGLAVGLPLQSSIVHGHTAQAQPAWSAPSPPRSPTSPW